MQRRVGSSLGSDKKPRRSGAIVSIVFSLLLIAAAVWVYFYRQYVVDQLSVWSYQPTSQVATIEERIDFSKTGAFYFYATKPSIDSSDTFNGDCPRQEANSPILGCYGSNHIYIYDVTNAQLDGIKEVTAAHETLHAIWERMSENDRADVSVLLEKQYASMNDVSLKERMDYYKRTEPGEFDNELHSIIGTEVASIDPALETYYSKYFNDRSKVTALHEKYNSVFENLKAQSASLYDDITAIGKKIESDSNQYEADAAQLKSDIADFNQRASGASFSSVAQFNRERAALVQRSDALDASRQSINAQIANYNEKTKQYNELSVQLETLNKSIDSFGSIQPGPSL